MSAPWSQELGHRALWLPVAGAYRYGHEMEHVLPHRKSIPSASPSRAPPHPEGPAPGPGNRSSYPEALPHAPPRHVDTHILAGLLLGQCTWPRRWGRGRAPLAQPLQLANRDQAPRHVPSCCPHSSLPRCLPPRRGPVGRRCAGPIKRQVLRAASGPRVPHPRLTRCSPSAPRGTEWAPRPVVICLLLPTAALAREPRSWTVVTETLGPLTQPSASWFFTEAAEPGSGSACVGRGGPCGLRAHLPWTGGGPPGLKGEGASCLWACEGGH